MKQNWQNPRVANNQVAWINEVFTLHEKKGGISNITQKKHDLLKLF